MGVRRPGLEGDAKASGASCRGGKTRGRTGRESGEIKRAGALEMPMDNHKATDQEGERAGPRVICFLPCTPSPVSKSDDDG